MTAIEWTQRPGTKGETWNPIVGCSIVSPGCTNCYAMRMAGRLLNINAGRALDRARAVEAQFIDYGTPEQQDHYAAALRSSPSHYDGTVDWAKGKPVWTGKVALAPDHILAKPLQWRSPRTVFVNSMGDLFHEDVPDVWIDRVFSVMALSPRHTFQVLTKRSQRMLAYMSSGPCARWVDTDAWKADGPHWNEKIVNRRATEIVFGGLSVLPNVWLGVSAERQQEADARIPDLLATPAAVRFVSAEPLLGPVAFRGIWEHCPVHDFPGGFCVGPCPSRRRLDWIIAGGESGPGARPMHPDWARSIRDQCAAAAVPFFFKQWGEYAWEGQSKPDGGKWLWSLETESHQRVGKSKAGRLIDGREHSEWPFMVGA